MEFIRNHWFGLLMSLLFASYLVIFLMGLFSPQTFSVCTDKMADEFIECGGQILCGAKSIISNLLCEIKLVL